VWDFSEEPACRRGKLASWRPLLTSFVSSTPSGFRFFGSFFGRTKNRGTHLRDELGVAKEQEIRKEEYVNPPTLLRRRGFQKIRHGLKIRASFRKKGA